MTPHGTLYQAGQAVGGHGAQGTFGRVASDVSSLEVERRRVERIKTQQSARGGPFNPIRVRNQASAGNPLLQASESCDDGEVEDKDALLRTAIRMFLGGDIAARQFVEFLLEAAGDAVLGVKEGAELVLKRHEENGPYSFKKMLEEVRKLVQK